MIMKQLMPKSKNDKGSKCGGLILIRLGLLFSVLHKLCMFAFYYMLINFKCVDAYCYDICLSILDEKSYRACSFF